MWRNLPLIAAGGLILFSGIVHGLWTDRWYAAPAVEEFVARLDGIPRDLDEWHGTDLKLTDQELRVGRIDGYCYRRYQNASNRHTITMLVVCGRAGPIAVHTPDVCFEGAGYRAVGSKTPFTLAYGVNDASATFTTMRFNRPEEAQPTEIRVFWSWSPGGPWSAPDNPRMTFAGRHALYKMYVLREKTEDDLSPAQDPCTEFLKKMLPVLESKLTPDNGG